MKKINLEYIARTVGDLSGIPVRIYEGKELVFYHSPVHLTKDPIELYLSEILAKKEDICTFFTEDFSYYGIVASKEKKLVIGPSSQTPYSDAAIKNLAFLLDIKRSEAEEFALALRSIVPMPPDSIMQILCVVNHVLNGKEVELKEMTISDDQQTKITQEMERERVVAKERQNDVHNTFFIEQKIENMIASGDIDGFREWASHAQAVRGGTVAFDQMRQMKNTFIVTATIASRAAIRGGLNVEEALSLSDLYIKRCELTYVVSDITNLQYHMISDFIERVDRLRLGPTPTELTVAVCNYVRQHISEPLTAEQIAVRLAVSRTHLSRKFHENTGKTLIMYIQEEKIREAKRLLRYTAKSIVDIGNYLGYSSSSYFIRSFKKIVGITPKEYRAQ